MMMTNYDCCNCSCFFRFLDVFFAPCFVCVVSAIVRTIRHAQCILSVTRLTHLISYNTHWGFQKTSAATGQTKTASRESWLMIIIIILVTHWTFTCWMNLLKKTVVCWLKGPLRVSWFCSAEPLVSFVVWGPCLSILQLSYITSRLFRRLWGPSTSLWLLAPCVSMRSHAPGKGNVLCMN